MPKRVVLVEPRYRDFDFDYLPQGILSIAAYLKNAGFDVSVHRSLPLPQHADVLGISATTAQYIEALNIARKSTAGITVIGGAHVTTAPGDAMASCFFDYGIVGDGEESFVDLCNNRAPREIPGVLYRNRDVVMASHSVPFKFRLRDGGPEIPAYDLLDGEIGTYVNVCRNREWVWQHKWIRRNRVKYWKIFTREISILKNLGVTAVHVSDENFGAWNKNIRTTVHALDRLTWWTCRSGVKNFLVNRLDQALFSSKCRGIEIEVISANKRLLEEFCDYTVEDAELAIELAEGIGLEVTVCATLGLPGETVNSMIDTWNWLRGRRVRIETVSPLPGTVFYEEPDNFGQFGYEVVIRELGELGNCDRLPWKMNTISYSEFVDIRQRMQKEFTEGKCLQQD